MTKNKISENEHCQHGDHSHKGCVGAVPIFNHLEDEQMNEIMVTVRSVAYKKGEHIYHADDEADSLYIVNKGKVRIYRLSQSGKEQLVRMLNPGDFTGELALFKEEKHESYAEAIHDTEICVMKRDDLQAFLLKYPTISLKILSEFSNRLDEAEIQTTRFATEKVETRLALFLADCVSEDDDNYEFVLPLSKKDLAAYLGTTPETISRKLATLEEQGYIKQKQHKKIQILDLDGLLLI
ncbi:Crp/Fnr family transcriptional regulator [Paraliobacillus quinghaiensis]|uniref:Crp/Fnr family transcriptional regulator n=1 Tax=Paraliobacillus quinghaiensis TaxID=470815 RepID=A0A917TVE7_9BACI|nr:Crp/Fnr family transcriptional regulator [Paraliobacillus quinghaiensis]GGM37276.1 Crp/Fnr family transcriptional regulator [Paraliobacillus quinghaiensis]